MNKSTHRVETVPFEMRPHPDADSLSVVEIFGGGYTYVARTEDWTGVTKAAYIPPDSVVDVTRPEFEFLRRKPIWGPDGKVVGHTVDEAMTTARVKAKKLRGVVSFGLMIPVPDDTPLGEDWAERLGVTHYEPPLSHEKGAKGPILGGDESPAPAVHVPTYDVDAFRRYHHVFEPGEPVVITEKLDGANARFVYHDGEFHCGSRNRWTREFNDYPHLTAEYLEGQGVPPEKAQEIISRYTSRPSKRNIWWEALRGTPELEKFLVDNPGVIVYGEVAGTTNVLKYSKTNHFAAFDIMRDGRWLDYHEARAMAPDLPWVPDLATDVAYDFDTVCRFAEGDTTWGKATNKVMREGVVVKPIKERRDPRIGRVQLKVVSAAFLEKYR